VGVSEQSYTREEMDEILRRALERQARAEGGVAHEDLVAAARDLAAERSAPTLPPSAARVEASSLVQDRQRAKRRLARDLAIYVVTNAAILAFCLVNGGNWYIWTLLGGGVTLGKQAVNVLFPKEPDDARALAPAGPLRVAAFDPRVDQAADTVAARFAVASRARVVADAHEAEVGRADAENADDAPEETKAKRLP
jgi:hypothetical protein